MLDEVKRLSFDFIPSDINARIWSAIIFVRNIAGVYVLWMMANYMAAHLYVSWCVPATLVGFIASPFMIPAPHCQALRWAIYTGGNSIMSMWGALGLWLMKKINKEE
jgi:hypothetical protein